MLHQKTAQGKTYLVEACTNPWGAMYHSFLQGESIMRRPSLPHLEHQTVFQPVIPFVGYSEFEAWTCLCQLNQSGQLEIFLVVYSVKNERTGTKHTYRKVST